LSGSAYLIKISSTGSSILYSSYLGSENNESVGYGIAADFTGNAYVTGLTYATDFPMTTGALQSTSGGAGDAFVSRVNTNLNGPPSLTYSTYLGGAGLDQGNGIAVDGSGNIYVAGGTNSIASSLLFTPPVGAFQSNCDAALAPGPTCQGDAFVAKLNPNLSGAGSLVYFTYLGGSELDSASGIAVDNLGDAFVTGSTVSGALPSDTPFPIDQLAFQPAYGGGNADSFVTELNPQGSFIVYSSYLGGTNAEIAGGIAISIDPLTGSGSAYVSGQTCSTDFPVVNALQPVAGGNCDAYVAKVSTLAGFAFNPTSLVFQAQSLNTTSQSQTITLTNNGNLQTIESIDIKGTDPGDFAMTRTCGSSIASGATCTVSVSFTPAAPGIRTATLVFTDTDSTDSGVQILKLSGITSNVTLSTASLSFDPQPVGTSSAAQPVTVTNSGTTPLTFSSITASGDFSEKDTCTKAALQPNTNCVVQVTFAPSSAVASIGTVTLTDTGSGSPQVILTTGTGVQANPVVSLSPNTLTFAGQPVGSSSATQAISLTNTGSAALTISSVTASGDFAQINACPTSVADGASCTINVTFTPTASGNRFGSITIADNAPDSPQTISMTGIGTGATFQIGSLTATPAVPAGKTATYAISVTSSGGFAQQVALSCIAPATISCTVSPSIVTPSAAPSQSAMLTVTTALRTIVPPSSRIKIDPIDMLRHFKGTWLMWLMVVFIVLTVAKFRRRPITAAFGFAVVLLLVSAACSGGGASGVPAGTPRGNYQITVKGTSGSVTTSTVVTLQVN
jgi:hypothetical protein